MTEELVPPVRGAGGGGRSRREPGDGRGDGGGAGHPRLGPSLAGGAAVKMEPPPEPHTIAAARSEQRIMAADWSHGGRGGSDSACSQRRRSWRGRRAAGGVGAGGRGCVRAGGRPRRAGARVPAAGGPGRARSRESEPPRGRPPAGPAGAASCACPAPADSLAPRPGPQSARGSAAGVLRRGWRRKKATVKGRGGEGACLPGSLRVCHARLAREAVLSLTYSPLLSCAIKFETQGFPLVLYFIHALPPLPPHWENAVFCAFLLT